jgi:hypothetical protein
MNLKENEGIIKQAAYFIRLIRVASFFITFTVIHYITAVLVSLSGLELLNIFVVINWLYVLGQTISDLKNVRRHVDDKFRKEI